MAAAYDLKTGREVGQFVEGVLSGINGRRRAASHTGLGGWARPLGAEGELRCLDALTGKLLWRTNILTDSGATNPVGHGRVAASRRRYGDRHARRKGVAA
ncbi:MAG: hypothetical protein IPP47_07635 [Bryobacterales bacterium]|nr:hypothetical protein [Bryobacterales bacterium]